MKTRRKGENRTAEEKISDRHAKRENGFTHKTFGVDLPVNAHYLCVCVCVCVSAHAELTVKKVDSCSKRKKQHILLYAICIFVWNTFWGKSRFLQKK